MAHYIQIQSSSKNLMFLGLSLLNQGFHIQTKPILIPMKQSHSNHRTESQYWNLRSKGNHRGVVFVCNGQLFPVDSWAQNLDSPVIASQLSAVSLVPYMGFLYFITKSKSSPRLTVFGFYFLLAFIAAAIPAGIYAKAHYAKSLSNVDWLHGGVESLLMVTNLFVVLGLRRALRNGEHDSGNTVSFTCQVKEEEKSSV